MTSENTTLDIDPDWTSDWTEHLDFDRWCIPETLEYPATFWSDDLQRRRSSTSNQDLAPFGMDLNSTIDWTKPFDFEYFLGVGPRETYGSSSAFTSSPNFENCLSTAPTPSSVASNDITSQDSRCSSPLASGRLTALSAKVGCERCPEAIFRGTTSSQRRSLRRHKRTVHGIDQRLACPYPGCIDTFAPGRGDNRKRHVERQHGVVPVLIEPPIDGKGKLIGDDG